MITRIIQKSLDEALTQYPAVALLGTRQVGKTTLALDTGTYTNAIYLDLESPDDLTKLSDPIAYLQRHKDRLIILDEIQRAPDLFMALRGIIDQNRREGKKSGQFLLLGSASIELLRQSSESLAGRIHYLEMTGLNRLEVPDTPTLWLRGGYPESYLATTDAHAMGWIENLIRSYIERDIPQLGLKIPSIQLRRLWTMAAHLQGEPINMSTLGANLGIDAKTARHYVDILTDLLLLRRLEPWHENVKKRLVKSPRFYVRDSGILHRLLGIPNYESLLGHPILGKSFEGFIIENLLSVLPHGAQAFFYRTAAGAEIDLILNIGNERWAIEIKTGGAPKPTRGFYEACQDINPTHRFIVYSGNDEFPISNEITVISLENLMRRLKNQG